MISAILWRFKEKLAGEYALSGTLSLIFLSTIAVVYTTPWDNYLVAERIWWYDVDKVIGTIGHVPIEEYLFFVLQVVLTGLSLILIRGIMRRFQPPSTRQSSPRSILYPPIACILVSAWIYILIATQNDLFPGRYFSLLMLWALPPLALQFGFGGDILAADRWPALITLALLTLYLSFADLLAIDVGIWTINPDETFGIYLFGILPLEEALFFLMTNALIINGIALCLSPQTWTRINQYRSRPPLGIPSGD